MHRLDILHRLTTSAPQLSMDPELRRRVRALTRESRNEVGGLLLGQNRPDGTIEYLMAAFPPQIQQTPTFCNFSDRHRAALELVAARTPLGRILPRVDWIHTHPGLGVFLSGTDRSTFAAFRQERPNGLAVVFDPVANTLGGFASPTGSQIDVAAAAGPLDPLVTEACVLAHLALLMSGVERICHAGPDRRATRIELRARGMMHVLEAMKDFAFGESASRAEGYEDALNRHRSATDERLVALEARLAELEFRDAVHEGPAPAPETAPAATISASDCQAAPAPASQERTNEASPHDHHESHDPPTSHVD